MPGNRVVQELQDLGTLVEDGGGHIGINLFQRFETRFQPGAFLGCFGLACLGRSIDGYHPCPGGGEKRGFYFFVFELRCKLIEFGTNADGIENILILSGSRRSEEKKEGGI